MMPTPILPPTERPPHNYPVPEAVPAMPEPWSDDRQRDLDRLRELLRELNMLDCSPGALGRLRRAVELAEELTVSVQGAGRDSFLLFLVRRANGEGSR